MIEPVVDNLDQFEAMNDRLRKAWADRLELELHGFKAPVEPVEVPR